MKGWDDVLAGKGERDKAKGCGSGQLSLRNRRTVLTVTEYVSVRLCPCLSLNDVHCQGLVFIDLTSSLFNGPSFLYS